MATITCRGLAIAALCLAGTATQAATVFKCTDDQGHTVFSQTPCAPPGEGDRLHVDDPGPGVMPPRSPMEQLEAMRQIREGGATGAGVPREQRSAPTYGGSQDDCAQLSHIRRRNMVVGNEMFRCMTKSELRSVMEREPDSVHSSSSGSESWHYHHPDGSSTHVFFDSEGLVRSWSGWR